MTGGGIKAEEVGIQPGSDDAGGVEGGAVQCGGSDDGIAVVIGFLRHVGQHGAQVILRPVGEGVFAFAEVGDGIVVTIAHDGGPIGMAGVIFGRFVGHGGRVIQAAVVLEADGVADLVAGGFSDVFWDAVAELGDEDEAGGV